MFEIMTACGLIFAGLFLVAIALKLVLALVLLPLQIGLFFVKGLLFLVFGLPLILLSIAAASIVIPLLAVFALPVLVVVGGIVLLVKILT
jgi:hypothetical protein